LNELFNGNESKQEICMEGEKADVGYENCSATLPWHPNYAMQKAV